MCKESSLLLQMHCPGLSSHLQLKSMRGSEEEEDSIVVALNVVVTVSRPMLSKSIVTDALRAYKADKEIRKTLTIQT
jgi:hypothetical protein